MSFHKPHYNLVSVKKKDSKKTSKNGKTGDQKSDKLSIIENFQQVIICVLRKFKKKITFYVKLKLYAQSEDVM